jgi:hypothetical protein
MRIGKVYWMAVQIRQMTQRFSKKFGSERLFLTNPHEMFNHCGIRPSTP